MNKELAGAYKEFLDSPVGKDFLQFLVGLELSHEINAFRATSHEEKINAIERMHGVYDVRTALADISKPKVSTGGKMHSGRP